MPTTLQQTRRQAKRLLRWCRQNGDIDDARARRAMNTIVGARPRGYLALLSQFQRLLKLDRARYLARVESAVPLVPELQTRVRENLQAAYGPGVTAGFVHNPSLIGGMRIQVGSDVYDGSVRSRLAALQRSLGIESMPGTL